MIEQIRISEIYLNPFRIDQVTSTLSYIGYVDTNIQGIHETESIWRIKRIKQTGTVWKIEYPNGDSSFDFVWADRALLNYK